MKELLVEQFKPMLVDMLQFFHDFCQQHEIKYYMTGGTLLGAVRHQGFIPWDDDIDITLPRADYERLLDTFEDPTGRYQVVSIRNPGYYLSSAKIIDTTTTMKENYDVSFEIGLFIDLFPMDNLSDDLMVAKKMFRKLKMDRQALTIKNLVVNSKRAFYKNIILQMGKVVWSPISRAAILKTIDQKSKEFENDQMTQYVGTVATGIYGEKEIFKKQWFDQSVLLPFENHRFYAPVGYHQLLTQLYGDYMQLPPKEKQITHHDNQVWLK